MSDIRQLLKDHATQMIRKGGYHAFSFRDLANLAGIKSSSVHYYFPTKSSLVLEVIQDYHTTFFKNLEESASRMKTAHKRLLCLIQLYENSLKKDAGCLCGVLSAEFELLSTAERQALSQFFSQIEQWLITQFEVIDLADSLSAKHYANLIMSSLNGALLIDRLSASKRKLDSIHHFLSTLA